MRLKGILYFALPALAIILLNFFLGSVISWFLSIAIIACLLYYFTQINIENLIYRNTNAGEVSDTVKAHAAQVIRKYKVVLSFGLMTVVFVSSIFCIRKTANPGGAHPWFFNNDYHGISNNGIAFRQSLSYSLPADDSLGVTGRLSFTRSGAGVAMSCRDFYRPIFAETGEAGRYVPVNDIFPKQFQGSFSIYNTRNRIDVKLRGGKAGFLDFLKPGSRKPVVYDINLQANDPALAAELNIPLPFSDHIVIEERALREGKSLYNLFLNSRSFGSNRNESYAVLEYILRQLGDSYLLNHNDPEHASYTVFPGASFIARGYRLVADGQEVSPQTANQVMLEAGRKFYIGFHNVQEKAYCAEVDAAAYGLPGNGSSMAFIFDYPASYLLSSPSEQQQAGNKNLRFIANNNDDIINSDLREGFLFRNYDLNTAYRISGNMDYLTQQPNVPLRIGISDNNRRNIYQQVEGLQFHLQSTDPGVQYLFTIRDYSQNGFQYSKLILFAGLLYLGMLGVLIFFPGKNLVRIEPVIFAVIYALLILRFILYWRLATFPPLENISKYELENTILNFDYKWGFTWPVPLTLLWVFGFLGILSLYRWRQGKGHIVRFSPEQRWQLTTPKRIYKAYGLFILACLLLYFFNDKVLHMEILTRVSSILIPVTGYCYFSMLANKHFRFEQAWVAAGEGKGYIRMKAYVHYFIHNPSFVLTLTTIAFFALTDRGFAILFTLFILLKNIFLNFLKKPFDSGKTTLGRMLLQPNNYWIYGILSLVVYLVILSFKSLFYYLLTYKLVVAGLALLLPTLILIFFYRKYRKITLSMTVLTALYFLLLLIPASRHLLESKATGAIKHVQYRASIIHQPISDLLAQNPYSSFQTRKIIETAENQWFINSYISKPYRPQSVINLRPYSKVGVDYNTQTRDVVLARFVISELGSFTMYLILFLVLLPLVLYLVSYRLTDEQHHRLNYRSYAGVLPLLLIFTISLFVWLTATNRFVFFGQDFPFLSLTSKLSVVLPLILYAITLTQQPATYRSYQLNLRTNLVRYAFFTALVAAFALTTIKGNELGSDNFSIVVEKTQDRINKDLNAVLYELQDSLEARHKRFTYSGLIKALGADKRFRAILEDSVTDNYTRSILEQLIEKPSNAFHIDNPLYMLYDNDKYSALYNEHMYLELPPVENRKVWNGSVTENLDLATPQVNISYNGNNIVTSLPYFRNDPAASLQLAIMPAAWFTGVKGPVGILNVQNAVRQQAALFIYKKTDNNIIQNATAFASTCHNEDIVSVNLPESKFIIAYSNAGNYFALNKWINGSYKLLYPQKENNFWMYHFANAIRSAYKADTMLQENVAVSLDYSLGQRVQQMIDRSYRESTKGNRRFKFSVIAADGSGNVRLMNDFVTNRIPLDPNDGASISKLQQRHFFFSNIRNERDQWGNANLMALHLGPGSSIKPLTAAAIASQVNAGWEQLHLMAPAQAEYSNYGGYVLKKPWKNDDHYRAVLSLDKYIEVSSNFYQSVMIFLGSYPRHAFVKANTVSLKNVLSAQAGRNNSYPVFELGGYTYYLPNYDGRKGNWPATGAAQEKQRSFFGDENSVLANGLEINAGLRTKDKDKNDRSPGSYTRVNIVDSQMYQLLSGSRNSFFLWSFPEQSSFLQSQRAFPEASQNFNLGLKTTTLGGYPYQVSPFKMLEMYTSLLTQNRNLNLHVVAGNQPKVNWYLDSSWNSSSNFSRFLAAYIFKGMNDVIYGGSGTAHALGGLRGAHPGFYFYAKTGTINEEGSGARNSRRLIVAISNKDLQQAWNIAGTDTRIYTFYFAVDNNRDFDWSLLNNIINETMASQSFRSYFR